MTFVRTRISESLDLMLSVCLFLVAMGAAAGAIAARGWAFASLGLGAVILLIGALVVMRVHAAIWRLAGRSTRLRRSAQQAEEHYVDVLWRIVHLVEDRDKHHRGHSDRVGRLSEKLAHRLALPPETCRMMNLAGRLHDIGMLAVPQSIVTQRSTIGADAFRSIKEHPSISWEVLKPLELLDEVLPAIRHHHERMNGTGYPSGLSGEEIPLTARILAVADTYDAMTHDRPHRDAATPLSAVHELRRCTPEGYDARCVEALADVLHLPALEEPAPLLEALAVQ